MRVNLLVSMLLLPAVLVPAAARATILADWSLAERVQRADHIVVGVVGERRILREGGRILTEIGIRVEETLAGEPTDHLVVTQLGGRWGDAVVEVIGTARLTAGQRVLLFVERRGRRNLLLGMSLGAFRLDGERRAHQVVEVPLAARDGTVRPAPGARTVDLERIRELIRARRAAPPAGGRP